MSLNTIKARGEYLGFCEQKGYLYSVFTGYDFIGRQKFTIYAIRGGYAEYLIDFSIYIERTAS
jgi:hypothetical protein